MSSENGDLDLQDLLIWEQISVGYQCHPQTHFCVSPTPVHLALIPVPPREQRMSSNFRRQQTFSSVRRVTTHGNSGVKPFTIVSPVTVRTLKLSDVDGRTAVYVTGGTECDRLTDMPCTIGIGSKGSAPQLIGHV